MKDFQLSGLLKRPALLLAVGALTLTSCEKDDNDLFIDSNDVAQLYVSSNTSGEVTIFDLAQREDPVSHFMRVKNVDADGIHYDTKKDVLYQLDRTNNRINVYRSLSTKSKGDLMTPDAVSSSDFTNGREMTVSADGRYLVVAQDADDKMGNRFFVYLISPFVTELERVIETDINLWGIHFSGEHLFAVVDNSPNIAVFYKFFDHKDGETVQPSVTMEIEGIKRTHGIDYDGINDIMFLTDVGDAANGEDGAIVVIHEFSTKAGEAIDIGSPQVFQTFGFMLKHQQVRLEGPRTLLGNPVDIAYCRQNRKIYVAERKNNGGRILEFDLPFGNANARPTFKQNVAGASAVYLAVEDVPGF